MNARRFSTSLVRLGIVLFLSFALGLMNVTVRAGQRQFSAKDKLSKMLVESKPSQETRAGAPAKQQKKLAGTPTTTLQKATAPPIASSPSYPVAGTQAPQKLPSSSPSVEETTQKASHAGFSLTTILVALGIVGAGAFGFALYRGKVKSFRHWGLSAKVTAVAVAAVFPLVLVVLFYILPTVGEKLSEDKIQATKQVVDVAYGLMAEHQKEVDEGRITVDEAKQRALTRIQGLRYNKDDYFWINDLNPTMIMHPFKPELNGKDISDNKDPNGKRMFVEMVEVCKNHGEGPVEYMWPKPGVDKPVPKISYVKLYKPWGWIVGSGIYVEDIEAQIDALRAGISVGVLLAVILSSVLGIVVGRVIGKPVHEVATQMQNADLNTEFHSDVQNEIGDLQRASDRFVGSIRQTLMQVKEASVAVAGASTEISSSTEQMAAGAQEQTSQASEVAGAVEEMTKTIVENSRNASETAETARQARAAAEKGGRVVQETVAGMKGIAEVVNMSAGIVKELGKSSEQIGEIITVIDDIADQTNLLALNAAIEAARAGDQGRGFAVVADEVRKLAERTTNATKEIAGMIKKIQSDTTEAVRSMGDGTQKVTQGIELADKAGASLREIVDISQKVTDMVAQIATASEQQSTASEQISKNVEAISAVTGQTASGTQQIARAAEDLNRLTENLQLLVGRFRLDAQHKIEPAPMIVAPRKDHGEKVKVAMREHGELVQHQ